MLPDLQMDILGAFHIVIADIVDQHHRRTGGQDLAHKALVGLHEECIAVIVDAELHKDHIRPVLQQVGLHPCHAKLGGSAADARVDESGVGEMLLPPLEHPGGIAVLLAGGKAALGDGAAQEADGHRLSPACPFKYLLDSIPVAAVDDSLFKVDHASSSQISSPIAALGFDHEFQVIKARFIDLHGDGTGIAVILKTGHTALALHADIAGKRSVLRLAHGDGLGLPGVFPLGRNSQRSRKASGKQRRSDPSVSHVRLPFPRKWTLIIS